MTIVLDTRLPFRKSELSILSLTYIENLLLRIIMTENEIAKIVFIKGLKIHKIIRT